jgi:hypothetical protein
MRAKSKPKTLERERINITLHPEVRDMGEKLAQEDKRELSYELEWLIESEFSRRFTKAA